MCNSPGLLVHTMAPSGGNCGKYSAVSKHPARSSEVVGRWSLSRSPLFSALAYVLGGIKSQDSVKGLSPRLLLCFCLPSPPLTIYVCPSAEPHRLYHSRSLFPTFLRESIMPN
ncbi:unnamed protein product [Pleuronectes platessa]|uniref:Uncharacterized protein n=1 Tax=Pleuronectes platessa TaxID=8262 RepID=A0A9N7Z905_PLEPL|nr:unnamed protein product [Pleuronectes platessa]